MTAEGRHREVGLEYLCLTVINRKRDRMGMKKKSVTGEEREKSKKKINQKTWNVFRLGEKPGFNLRQCCTLTP